MELVCVHLDTSLVIAESVNFHAHLHNLPSKEPVPYVHSTLSLMQQSMDALALQDFIWTTMEFAKN
jgi:hypothetical protein